MKYGKISGFLESARVLIENARDIPSVALAVADYGYDSHRLQGGVALLSAAQSLVSQQAKEYGESYQATEVMNRTWETADVAYVKAVKVARVAFGDDPKATVALRLSGPRKETLPGWMEQATLFYDNLLSDVGLQATMAQYGYLVTRLRDEQKLVAAVRQAVNVQARESGEAQSATLSRDKALNALDTWVSAFKAICRVALAEDPQQLEQLGIVVLNQARRKAKVNA